ncbi:MAG: diguanylate cyclase [Rhizobacter sp.]|nr:diguanylate cyclase [Rhizobacter sp.]
MPIRRCLSLLFLLAAVLVAPALATPAWGQPLPAAAMVEYAVGAGPASVPVDRGVELLVEETGEALTPEQVMSPALASRWQVFPRRVVNLPGQRKAVWLRLAVRNAAEADSAWVLGIEWPLLEQVDFHRLDPVSRRWAPPLRSGIGYPDAPRLQKDPSLVFPVSLAPRQRAVLLLRVHTHNQLVAPLTLWDQQAWQASRYDHGVMLGLLFGILGVMLCYNLSLYAFTGEKSFRSYAAYLLSIIGYELAVTGLGPLYVWGGSDWLNHRAYELFGASSFLAATLFFRRFLALGRAAPHLNRMNQFFIVFWGVMVVVTLFPTSLPAVIALTLGGIVVGFVAVYTAGYLALRGNVLARYFFIAWVTIIVATFLTLLWLAGVIEGGGWVQYAQHIGFVVETVLLSMALAERIKRERLSKEAAERQSLELSHKVDQEREEKIRAQEHALAVQLKANEELELRVLDRTAELKRAMENVELANRELAKLSVTDSLTKVHNRRYFDDALKKEYDRSARTGTPLALMMADIDHFKRINDSVGHLAGDECLKLVAGTLAQSVGRSTDLVARYGGEEFAIVLPGADAARALEMAERIRKAVQDIEFIYRGQRVPMSISLGVVARVADPARPLAEFISEADQALYAAKGAGRNRAMLFEAA